MKIRLFPNPPCDKRKQIITSLVFSILILAVWLSAFWIKGSLKQFSRERNASNKDKITLLTDRIKNADDRLIYDGIVNANQETITKDFRVKGGIVPHHLLASFLTARFFHLAQGNYENVIIIGPNHEETGKGKILTSKGRKETFTGEVLMDEVVVQQLIESKIAYLDEDTLSKESSINNLLPFVKYYLSETKVIPLVLSSTLNIEGINKLVNGLIPFLGEKTLVVASVDFSHYLSKETAFKKDEITLQTINNLEHETLLRMNSDYLDSPTSVVTLLLLLEKIDKNHLTVWNHLNSAQIVSENQKSTTSYFMITFH